MTAVLTYSVGTPLPAAQRGGDCRARDLDEGRNVHGPHRFAATTHCRIGNGLLRATVGASGAAPSLSIEVYRGTQITGDTYTVTYHSTYGGIISDLGWEALGTVTIDSTGVTALLTGVRIASISAEQVTLRLVAPVMGDAYVTLRRGERMIRITHGNFRAGVSVTRRVRWTDSPSPTGTATATSRIDEVTTGPGDCTRFVASLVSTTANTGAFSLTSSAAKSARFGAGVGTSATRDTSADMHRQLRDASRARLVVA